MKKFINPSPISHKVAEKIFCNGTNHEVCDALVAITTYESDWKWVQMHCLHFLNHTDPDISGVAATCLGHLARIHHKLDKKLVIEALKNQLKNKDISSRVQDALDDIKIFLS